MFRRFGRSIVDLMCGDIHDRMALSVSIFSTVGAGYGLACGTDKLLKREPGVIYNDGSVMYSEALVAYPLFGGASGVICGVIMTPFLEFSIPVLAIAGLMKAENVIRKKVIYNSVYMIK